MARARKRFGQHFLEPAWVGKLIRAIDPQAGDVFLEIGPGRGALTRPLAVAARHVLAYEIDHDLAAALLGVATNVTVVDADFLNVGEDDVRSAIASVGTGPAIRVAGNLPYNVASPMLFRLGELFEAGLPLVDATVMLQHEVAERLCAAPGSRAYGVLPILIGMIAEVERLLTLPPGAFRPVPKVTSAVVRLQFRRAPVPPSNMRLFTALVHAVFSHRRKTLNNALKAFPPARALEPALALAHASLDGRRRPETLTPTELARLADAFAEASPGTFLAGRS
jgi:16S rRNA (adenine1518-N6/adenine1519-N6)-dimethyltransferase